MFDMDDAILDELLGFLEDGNGADPPEASNAKKRYQVQARLFKVQHQAIKELSSTLHKMDGKLDSLVDSLEQNPTVVLWIRNHLVRAVSVAITAIVFMLALWVALWTVFEIPAVAGWVREILNIPLPPVG